MNIANSVVMVTGGGGFIGSHLVRRLAESGVDRVLVVDTFQYGAEANLGECLDKVEIIPFRLGHDAPAGLAPFADRTDFLFHLAAEKHNQSRDNPRALLQISVTGTLDLLELAVQHAIKRVVFSSSLYAYGRTSGPPMTEDEPAAPITLYGISKLMGERLLETYRRQHGLATLVLRIFFAYGPRQFSGMGYKSVIVRNFERILRDECPVVFGDGRQALDYVFVEDVVDALLRSMESDRVGDLLNVSTGQPTSVLELSETMLRVSGCQRSIDFQPADEDGGSCRVGSNRKIKEALGWEPQTTVEQGLRATWEWMKQQEANR